jgi:hypothetical protein
MLDQPSSTLSDASAPEQQEVERSTAELENGELSLDETSAEEHAKDERPQDDSSKNERPKNDLQKAGRPFRVKLRGSVLVFVRLPNRRSVRAAIHQLSTTGGVIHMEKPLEEKLDVEMIFHIGETTIRGKAQMLFPMWATQGWMQPFRFVDLTEANREILDANLKSFVGDHARTAAAAR